MGAKILHLDFETRSGCDLVKSGVFVYCEDSSTDVIVACFAFDDEPVETWFPGNPVPKKIQEHVTSGGTVCAHNAPFEVAVNNFVAHPKYGFPVLNNEQMICTMTMAYSMALPGSLEKACLAVGLEKQKDMKGHRLMLQMSQPKKDGGWHNEPEKIQRLAEYCRTDVEVERELLKRLLKLSEKEKRVWLLDQKINQRGIKVDLPSIAIAQKIVEEEQERLDLKMRELTNQEVVSCTATLQIKSWLHAQGVMVSGVSKSDLLGCLKDTNSPTVQSVIQLRQEAGLSSTAKLSSMLMGANSDGRLRGLFQYHGAGTGRWASRRTQTQNFPRGNLKQKEVELFFELLKKENPRRAIELFLGSPLQTISSCLRSFITAEEGSELQWVDFSAIEARVLAWLADEASVLNIFRGDGKLYEASASKIFGISIENVSKWQRLIGKVAELALGYGGGIGAFQSMARGYGVQVSDQEADNIKRAWREARPNIVSFWYALNDAAMSAFYNPGKQFSVNDRISYLLRGSFLWCQLPSKRVLCYPYPQVDLVDTPWGEQKHALTYMAEDSFTHKWERQKAYGGLLAENVTQAVARDLLAESMLRLEEKGFKVVMHVHDEIVCEVPVISGGDATLKRIESIVCELPDWAKNLPVQAEGQRGFRYSK